jgi:hypothetical protein
VLKIFIALPRTLGQMASAPTVTPPRTTGRNYALYIVSVRRSLTESVSVCGKYLPVYPISSRWQQASGHPLTSGLGGANNTPTQDSDKLRNVTQGLGLGGGFCDHGNEP